MADKGENITTRFKVDISDLKAGIQEANKQIKLANAEFKAATAGMDDWAKSADGIKAKLSQLESVLSAQKSKLSAYQQELERNEKAYEENGKRAAELRKQLQQLAANGVSKTSDEYKTLEKELIATEKEQASNQKAADDLKLTILNQQAAVASTEKELRKYNTALDDVGKEEKETAKEGDGAKKGLKDVGDEAQKTEKKTGSLAKSLSKGLVKGLAAVGAAAGAAVSGLIAATISSGDYADELLTMSQVTGVSTESLQELQYAAELVDVSVDTITGTMRKNIQSMQKAANGSKEYEAAYKKLGVTVKNADGSMRDSEEVYWEMIDALGKMEEGTERDALAMQLFGKSAQELNPLINTGSEGMQELAKQAHEAGAVMSGDALKAMGKFDDAMEKLKSGTNAAKNALGTVLMPMLENLATEGTSLVAEFTKGINDAGGDWGKLSEVIGSTIGRIAEIILRELPKIMQMGVEIVMSLVRAIIKTLPSLIQSAAKLVPTIIKELVDAIPELINAAVQVFMALVDAIPLMLPVLIEAIPKIITAVVTTLIQNIPVLLQGAIKLFMALVQAIPTIVVELVKALPAIVTTFINTVSEPLKNVFSGIWSRLTDGAKNAWQGIKNVFGSVTGWFKSIFTDAWTAVKNVFSSAGTIFKGIKEGIVNAFKTVVNAIIRGINKVVAIPFNAINNALAKIRDVSILGIQPFKSLLANAYIRVPQIPLLEAGGVLRKGQVGLLEGKGAEAVVPLDRNKAWIAAVAGDMLKQLQQTEGNSLSNITNSRAVSYTQNIYSPKAPSRIDIYRQTRNLLAFAEAGGI